MKILFVSNHNPSFRNTNYYRERALVMLGHEVVFFDVRQYRLPARVRAAVPWVEEMETRRINALLVKTCAAGRFDLCLLVGGQTVSGDSVREIRGMGIPVFIWTSDVLRPQHARHIRGAALSYDKVFCAGTEMLDLFKELGRDDARWLPFACDPECHAPLSMDGDDGLFPQHDIVFVGSHYPCRAEILAALDNEDLGIWGPLWDRLAPQAPLRQKVCGTAVNFTDWIRIYASAKIVLAVHYQDGRTPCYQASPRLFEAMACGAFVLCDDQRDARALFNDTEHLVFFKDPQDLKQKVAYYLARPQERARIALAGRREVLEKHTYRQRFQEMFRA